MILHSSVKIRNIPTLHTIGVSLLKGALNRFFWSNYNYPYFLYEEMNRFLKGKDFKLKIESIIFCEEK